MKKIVGVLASVTVLIVLVFSCKKEEPINQEEITGKPNARVLKESFSRKICLHIG